MRNRDALREAAYAHGWRRQVTSRSDRLVFISFVRDGVVFEATMVADKVTNIRRRDHSFSEEARGADYSADQLMTMALSWLRAERTATDSRDDKGSRLRSAPEGDPGAPANA